MCQPQQMHHSNAKGYPIGMKDLEVYGKVSPKLKKLNKIIHIDSNEINIPWLKRLVTPFNAGKNCIP